MNGPIDDTMSTFAPERPQQLQRVIQQLRVQAVEPDADDANGAGGALGVAGPIVTYGAFNQNGWLWVPGACTESLAAKGPTNPLVMGYQHDAWESLTVIGVWDLAQTKETVESVYSAGRISDTADGRDAATLVQDGAITGISVGFYAEDYRWVEPGDVVSYETMFGKFTYEIDQYGIVCAKADVVEASLVAVPADFDARIDLVAQSVMQKAGVALPGLKTDAVWEDVAYSMAALMGGRGAAAFADLPEIQHRALHARLSSGYRRHGKTAPEYSRQPEYDTVAFQHDERELFADRYLRKNLAAVTAGARGLTGPLSAQTRDEALAAMQAVETALTRRTEGQQAIAELTDLFRSACSDKPS